MAATPLEEMEAWQVDRFWRWVVRFKDVLGIQKAPVADCAAVGILREGELRVAGKE